VDAADLRKGAETLQKLLQIHAVDFKPVRSRGHGSVVISRWPAHWPDKEKPPGGPAVSLLSARRPNGGRLQISGSGAEETHRDTANHQHQQSQQSDAPVTQGRHRNGYELGGAAGDLMRAIKTVVPGARQCCRVAVAFGCG